MSVRSAYCFWLCGWLGVWWEENNLAVLCSGIPVCIRDHSCPLKSHSYRRWFFSHELCRIYSIINTEGAEKRAVICSLSCSLSILGFMRFSISALNPKWSTKDLMFTTLTHGIDELEHQTSFSAIEVNLRKEKSQHFPETDRLPERWPMSRC